MKEENKCEKLGIAHAWRKTPEMWGMSILDKETCANCDLSRTHWYKSEEGYSYSDGRPDEPIINMRPC